MFPCVKVVLGARLLFFCEGRWLWLGCEGLVSLFLCCKLLPTSSPLSL